MKRSTEWLSISLLALGSISSMTARAAEPGWYLGGNLGQANATIDDERIAAGLLSNGLTVTSINDDERDLGFKLFGGYQLNRYFALEGGYFNLGKFGFDAITQPAGTVDGRLKVQGVNLDALAILPITPRFSAFGRAGVNYAEAKVRYRGTGAAAVGNPNREQRDANYKVGVGFEYAITPALGARLEAERYRIDDAVGNKGDIDLFTAGLVYRFGVAQPVAVAVVAAPPAPAPAPVAVAMPKPKPAPAPVPRRVTLSADSQFAFGAAELKPEGQQSLDTFAASLRGLQYEQITVTGHTDRIGSEDYNQALSLRRAEVVTRYLVDTAHIPSSRIVTRGMGESAPITTASDCPSSQDQQTMKRCLQPDRRVEIETSGQP